MEFLFLNSWGDWRAEEVEMARRFGWSRAADMKKFYPRQGHAWYYMVYGDPASRGPPNHAMR
jgi:hypothetical protein